MNRNPQMVAISERILLVFPTFLLFLPIRGSDTYRPDPSTADQEALLAFRSGIADDPKNVFENWQRSIHVCDWKGVECMNSLRVTNLSLYGHDLGGIISPFLSNLSHLQYLDLSANLIHGSIPPELGSLTMLKDLTFSQNRLEGPVPHSFGLLSNLRYISLSKNQLRGRLPLPLFYNCTKLRYIDLSNNFFAGFIPSSIGNRLPSLEDLFLYDNQLTGSIPTSISNCTNLVDLDLEFNYLNGRLPYHLFKYVTTLQTLHLSYNGFTSDDGNTNLSPFFESLANLTHLTELELAGNGIGGEIPEMIGLLRINLSHLQLDDNLIHGAIPPNITGLSNLILLNLSSNLLNGTIPAELSLLPSLERLCLSNNSLHGAIPEALGSSPHLGLLDLSQNKLSGPIPSSLSNLTQLRELRLSNNQLSGVISASLGKCERLEILDLAYNSLSGSIPGEVAALGDMTIYFNASNNLLTGNLPAELSKMNKVQAIDLSFNNLSGEIPPNLASCEEAELINLSHNQLQGSIPSLLGDLLSIQSLDLSQNKLTGGIPPSLQNCSNLISLNLSFNNLTGLVPRDGLFASLTIDSFLNNSFLCGSLQGLPPCQPKKQAYKQLYSRKFLLVLVTIVSGSAFLFTILCVVSFRSVKASLKTSSKDAGAIKRSSEALRSRHPRITYDELMEATGGFHERLLIGSGSFGRVYKGVLRQQSCSSEGAPNASSQPVKELQQRMPSSETNPTTDSDENRDGLQLAGLQSSCAPFHGEWEP